MSPITRITLGYKHSFIMLNLKLKQVCHAMARQNQCASISMYHIINGVKEHHNKIKFWTSNRNVVHCDPNDCHCKIMSITSLLPWAVYCYSPITANQAVCVCILPLSSVLYNICSAHFAGCH